MAGGESRWVVAPNDARIEIAVGPEAPLSPELREALERLARAVEEHDDVQGYMYCEQVKITQGCVTYIYCQVVGCMLLGISTG
jgi:hypothetical protein